MPTLNIHYKAEPTLAEFHRSSAFLRGIMGPVGCTSADTEYLSPDGWRRIDQYKGGPIAVWTSHPGVVSFETPKDYIVADCKELWAFSNSHGLSMVLSDEHRIPMYSQSNRFCVQSANSVAKNPPQYTVPYHFESNQRGVQYSPGMVRLIVAIRARGQFEDKKLPGACTIRLVDEQEKRRLREIFEEIGFVYKEKRNPIRPAETLFLFVSPYKWKHFDNIWLKATSGQLSAMIEEIGFWYDGGFCADKREADIVQYAAHASGLFAVIQNSGDLYKVKIKGSFKNIVDSTRTKRVPALKKYCFTVASGFFLARHKGVIFITGNSGKSVGCWEELMSKSMAQKPWKDGIRRTRWAVIRNCYDDETEILTENRGWQLFKELWDDDKVATLDGDQLVFKQPERVYAAPYKGDMIGFESEGVDFLVTPNHKMWVSKKRTRKQVWGDFEVKTAEEIYGTSKYRIRRDAQWEGHTTLTVEECEWLGYWYAEGSINIHNGILNCIITSVKDIDYARALFARAGIKYTERNRGEGKGVNFAADRDRPIVALCSGKSGTKFVPTEIKKAPSEHIKAFIHGFFVGDGHQRKDAITKTLYTSSKQLADDLQELALKAGMTANISMRDRVGEERVILGVKTKANYPEYTITLLCEKKYRPVLYVYKKHTNHLKGWYKVPYDGMVYCVEMPLVPVFIRRKGKPLFLLRTFPELKTTTIKTAIDWTPEPIMIMNWGSPVTGRIRFRLEDDTVVDAEILFIPLDSPKDVKKLLSLELTGAWLNEARELPYEVIQGVSMRLGRYPAKRYGGPSWVGMFMDTNPPDDDHWWFKYAEQECPEDWEFFRQPPALLRYADSKGGFLYINNKDAENVQNQPLGYRYWHNMIAGKSLDWINVYVMGNYGTIEDGKPVYPEYNDSIHCAKEDIEVIRSLPLRISWDFGLTPAVAIFQITPSGRCLVLDEIVALDMGVRRFIRDTVKPHLSNHYDGMKIISVGDPAGTQRSQTTEDTCMQILAEEGIRTTGAYTQEPVARREAVSVFLTGIDVDGKPNFQLSPKCRYLRKGFNGAFKYDRVQVANEERYKDKVNKNVYSHIAEALQYGLLEVVKGYRVRKPIVRKGPPRTALGWT